VLKEVLAWTLYNISIINSHQMKKSSGAMAIPQTIGNDS